MVGNHWTTVKGPSFIEMSENQWNKKWKKIDTHRNRDNPPKNSKKSEKTETHKNKGRQKDQQTTKKTNKT